MKTTELRIGNFITANGKQINVGHIQDNFYGVLVNGNGVDTGIYSQIPLNEEWLLKFGAKQLKPKRGVLKEFVLKTVRLEFSNSHNFYYKNSKVIITSVHQLQNLYFALTGKELTCE